MQEDQRSLRALPKGHNRTQDGGDEPALQEDFETLKTLLAFSCDKPAAARLARRLLTDLKSLPRVVAADADTFARFGLSARSVLLLEVFRRAMEQSLRRSLSAQPIMGSHGALIDYLHVAQAWREREAFRALFLNGQNELISDEIMSVGCVNQTSVHVREVIKRALDHHASALIIAHNHPSGSLTPSREDIQLTSRIREICRGLGITLHDHIIITGGGHVSFKALGLL